MKIILIVGIGITALLGIFMLVSEPSAENSSQIVQAASEEVTITTINQEVANGSAFLDVRTPEEYRTGYFNGAENFPLTSLQQGTYPDLDKDTRLYLYCRSGNRSAEAKSLLTAAGFTDVVDLGGLSDVQAIGGVLVN